MSETKVTIHAQYVDDELPPYDWKKKPINMPQGTAIEKMAGIDTIRRTWDMLTVADIFAMTFVAKGLREIIIDRLKKMKYITYRARQILLATLEKSLGGNARNFLEIMRDRKLYIGGSSILHGIMYDRPDVVPWSDSDIDSYVKSDAEFKLMREDMDVVFGKSSDSISNDILEQKYAGWWYGSWNGENSKIDVVSIQHGIECYDFTACQNSIDWEGRMRCFDPLAIINRELVLSGAFANKLWSAIRPSIHATNKCKDLGNVWRIMRPLAQRVDKYTTRSFSLVTDIEGIFDAFHIDGLFESVVPRSNLYDLRGRRWVRGGKCRCQSCKDINCKIQEHHMPK